MSIGQVNIKQQEIRMAMRFEVLNGVFNTLHAGNDLNGRIIFPEHGLQPFRGQLFILYDDQLHCFSLTAGGEWLLQTPYPIA